MQSKHEELKVGFLQPIDISKGRWLLVVYCTLRDGIELEGPRTPRRGATSQMRGESKDDVFHTRSSHEDQHTPLQQFYVSNPLADKVSIMFALN